MIFVKLPRWVQISAFLLAMNAGMVNLLALTVSLHQSISHMTGNMSLIAMAVDQLHFKKVLYLLLVLGCFVLGTFYSGFILGQGSVKLSRRYGTPLSLVGIFIILCWLFIDDYPHYALLWAASAMGMQNAMVSHYRGAIIRTTHLTGVLTDIGLALGYRARGLRIDGRRMLLHLLIVIGFFCGGTAAIMLYRKIGQNAFLLPAALTLSLSSVYWVMYFKYHHRLHDESV